MNTDQPMTNEEVRFYAEKYEAKRREDIELSMQLRMHERLTEPFQPLPLPVMPWMKKAERTFKWGTW